MENVTFDNIFFFIFQAAVRESPEELTVSQEDLVKEIDDEPLWFREIERADDDDDDEGKIKLGLLTHSYSQRPKAA